MAFWPHERSKAAKLPMEPPVVIYSSLTLNAEDRKDNLDEDGNPFPTKKDVLDELSKVLKSDSADDWVSDFVIFALGTCREMPGTTVFVFGVETRINAYEGTQKMEMRPAEQDIVLLGNSGTKRYTREDSRTGT